MQQLETTNFWALVIQIIHSSKFMDLEKILYHNPIFDTSTIQQLIYLSQLQTMESLIMKV